MLILLSLLGFAKYLISLEVANQRNYDRSVTVGIYYFDAK